MNLHFGELTVLEKQFGTKFGSVVSSEKIAQQMSASGTGARGIVFGSYGPGQPGHVFNVVNQNGVVRFLDGQAGKVANLAPYKTLQFMGNGAASPVCTSSGTR